MSNSLMVEFHYKDGDVGAYDVRGYGDSMFVSASRLWAMCAEGETPSHIVIRQCAQDNQDNMECD